MRMTVEADIDAEEVLEELSIEDIKEHLAGRKTIIEEHPGFLLAQVYEDFRKRGDAPQSLRDYLWTVLGRCLP